MKDDVRKRWWNWKTTCQQENGLEPNDNLAGIRPNKETGKQVDYDGLVEPLFFYKIMSLIAFNRPV